LGALSRTILHERKVLICVGPGGVGKTTTSAALGIEAAYDGLRTLVLTVDPARRLAHALGLTEMLPKPTEVPLPDAPGQLDAMMLDAKRTFDEVVSRHSPTEESRDRMLGNPFYQEASRSLAGCQEYMAMEELFSLATPDEYDLIILDTPPSRHALDFLDAPNRLRGFFESRTFSFFLESSSFLGKLGAGLFSKRSPVMMGMSKFVGGEAFSDLLTFLQAFHGMTEGFSERAERVDSLLRSSNVGFLVISGPDSTSMHEAEFLLKRIEQDALHLDGVLVNKVRPRYLNDAEIDELDEQIERSMDAKEGPSNALRLVRNYHHLVAADETARATLRSSLKGDCTVACAPFLSQPISDTEDMRRYARVILSQ